MQNLTKTISKTRCTWCYAITLHNLYYLSKQLPWRAAGDPRLARGRSRVWAQTPAGVLCAFFLHPPFLPPSEEFFLHLPHHPRESVRVNRYFILFYMLLHYIHSKTLITTLPLAAESPCYLQLITTVTTPSLSSHRVVTVQRSDWWNRSFTVYNITNPVKSYPENEVCFWAQRLNTTGNFTIINFSTVRESEKKKKKKKKKKKA